MEGREDIPTMKMHYAYCILHFKVTSYYLLTYRSQNSSVIQIVLNQNAQNSVFAIKFEMCPG
jgi:hypothetical protein